MSCLRCSPIFLIIRQIAAIGPREREFLIYKRDFIFRAIMFCLDVDVNMTDPVRDLTTLPILDDETLSQLIAKPREQGEFGVYGSASASNRRIDNKDIGFIIETIAILTTSLQFNDEWVILQPGEGEEEDGDWGGGNEDPMEVINNPDEASSGGKEDAGGSGTKDPLYFWNPNEPQMHSKRNEEIIEKFIKILLTENALWVDGVVTMSVHMCVSSKDMFGFFLKLFGKGFIRSSKICARNFIKLYVSLLGITDGKEDWRRKEFTRNLVSLLKEYEEKHMRGLIIRAMDGYSLIFNLTDHVLLQSYNLFKSDITSLIGKNNLSIYFS